MAFYIRGAGLVCLAGFIAAGGAQAPQTATAAPPNGGMGAVAAPQAQDKPLPEQSVTETRDEPAMFKTHVNLVMAPVVVRDSKGKTVTGLAKSDFLLFDKGKA